MWRRWATPQNFLLVFYWLTLKNLENKNSEKMKKNKEIKNKWKKICWRYHHFTHVYQNSQSGTVSQIWSGMRTFFVILGHFLSFTLTPNTPENTPPPSGDVHHFNTIKWCMPTETWSATDIIFCHFKPFFVLLPQICMVLRYKVQRKKLSVILGHFVLFNPPNNPKN